MTSDIIEKPSHVGALVIIESPYAGDIERNTLYARRAMRDSIERGENPMASHLLYTQPHILDEKKPEERARGIAAGFAWWRVAEKAVFYIDYGCSPGMEAAMQMAGELGKAYEIRQIGKNNSEAPTDKDKIIFDLERKYEEAREEITALNQCLIDSEKEAMILSEDMAEALRQQILCEIDTGADYLVARKAVAELSGKPVMALTFEEHIEVIRALLKAAPSVPDGWQFVPIKPTDRMYSAWDKECERCAIQNYGGSPTADDIWAIGLGAAQQPPAKEEK